MKFKTGLVVGIAIGYLVATRLRREGSSEDAPRTGVLGAMARHPSAQRFADQGRRLAERAGFRSAEALQRARAGLQRRLNASADDLSMN